MNEFMEAEREERRALEMVVSVLMLMIFMATLITIGFVVGNWSVREMTVESCK